MSMSLCSISGRYRYGYRCGIGTGRPTHLPVGQQVPYRISNRYYTGNLLNRSYSLLNRSYSLGRISNRSYSLVTPYQYRYRFFYNCEPIKTTHSKHVHTLNWYQGYQTIRPVANTTETAVTGRYTTDNQWFRHRVISGRAVSAHQISCRKHLLLLPSAGYRYNTDC